MQCSSCRAVFSEGLDSCPRCKVSSPERIEAIAASETSFQTEETEAACGLAGESCEREPTRDESRAASTLIEFPGASRNRPQWRKDLSERVREIQERRAREAAQAAAEKERLLLEEQSTIQEDFLPQLGLVPPLDESDLNPLVVKALRRIERARERPLSGSRAQPARQGIKAAVARVAREQAQSERKAEPVILLSPPAATPSRVQLAPAVKLEKSSTEKRLAFEKRSEAPRDHRLAVVRTEPATAPVTTNRRPEPRRVAAEVLDDAVLARLDAQLAEASRADKPVDARASLFARATGAMIDLLIIGFASSPFAAVIELTNGNWADIRVSASLAGIIAMVMFLYLSAATALSGRTWGMSVTSLRTTDAVTGLAPTTGQSVARALLYMLSLATLGVGLIYAVFDPEHRTAHDRLSGTAVVRE